MKNYTKTLGLLLAGVLSHGAAFGVIELNPIQDSDVYHGTDAPTGSTDTLGVSWDQEAPPGSEFYHGQSSVIQFDLSAVVEPITSATLYLYVEEISSGGFGGFTAGTVSVFEQTTAWDVGTLTWDDFSAGTDLGDLNVVNQGVWMTLDVTTIVQGWATNTIDNYGFLLTADGTTATQFASMETGATAPILALNGAASVPEPSTTAALFGIAVLGFVSVKRRRIRA